MHRRALLSLTGTLLSACGPPRVLNDGGDARGRVILMRGLVNIFSTGMDTLADRIAAAGYATEVHNHGARRVLAGRCVSDARAGDLPRPFVVIGHSLGADGAIGLAGWAGRQGVATDLLVTFDAAWASTVPRGPRRVLNFHSTLDLASHALRPAPGFDGVIENVALGPETRLDHFTIDDSPMLHARVVAALAGADGPLSKRPRRGARSPA